MERLHRTIYLIEENPLVKSFEYVEDVLKSIYGGRKVKTITTKRTIRILILAMVEEINLII